MTDRHHVRLVLVMNESLGRNSRHRAARLRSLISAVFVLLCLGAVTDVRASDAPRTQPVNSVDDWLEALGSSWHMFDNPTRSDVAHVWGLPVSYTHLTLPTNREV